jgi:hypothetical protein
VGEPTLGGVAVHGAGTVHDGDLAAWEGLGDVVTVIVDVGDSVGVARAEL